MMSNIQRVNGREIKMALDKKRAHLQKTYIWSSEFSTRNVFKDGYPSTKFSLYSQKIHDKMLFSVNPIIIIIILSSLLC